MHTPSLSSRSTTFHLKCIRLFVYILRPFFFLFLRAFQIIIEKKEEEEEKKEKRL